ncbi:MAG: hypothetical protein H6Q62_356, partial [Firmicutes bacterium]|nr:hypothetical protein [Bacillota bacterium]
MNQEIAHCCPDRNPVKCPAIYSGRNLARNPGRNLCRFSRRRGALGLLIIQAALLV